jgi:hypothetical protein
MLKRRTGLAVLVVAAAIIGVVLIRRATSPERTAPAVLVQVRQLNQLATVTYTVQKVIGIREQKQPVGSESILLIVQATVQAGVDLAGLHAEDVTVRRDGTVVVRLPPPQVLNVAIDEKNTKVWDRSKTWWAPWIPYSLDLEQRARLEGVEAVRQAALENGLLAQAQRNAEISIRGLLSLAGVKSVVVIPANVS